MTYSGETWGAGQPRFPTELVIGYSKLILEKGGIITWDVPLKKGGEIPDPFFRLMKSLGKALRP